MVNGVQSCELDLTVPSKNYSDVDRMLESHEKNFLSSKQEHTKFGSAYQTPIDR